MVTVVQPMLNEDEEAALLQIFEYLKDEEHEYKQLSPEEREKHIFRAVLILRADPYVPWERLELGSRVITPGATEALEKAGQQAWQFFSRQAARDWGDVCTDDWDENNLSLEQGFRILSSYRTAAGEKLWVITEADRSSTTILLPDEY